MDRGSEVVVGCFNATSGGLHVARRTGVTDPLARLKWRIRLQKRSNRKEHKEHKGFQCFASMTTSTQGVTVFYIASYCF
ncbi:hypothetical protein CCR95_06705 [Thiocystis minor]|nr:hypothetical protein [Thiocystis minor]